jgi:hypothetical protein
LSSGTAINGLAPTSSSLASSLQSRRCAKCFAFQKRAPEPLKRVRVVDAPSRAVLRETRNHLDRFLLLTVHCPFSACTTPTRVVTAVVFLHSCAASKSQFLATTISSRPDLTTPSDFSAGLSGYITTTGPLGPFAQQYLPFAFHQSENINQPF